jgi:hypothetical protein
LVGLRLGYRLIENQELTEKDYSVDWGRLPHYEILLETEEAANEDKPKFDPQENPLTFEFIDKLIDCLKNEMIRQTPPAALDGYVLDVYLYGSLNQLPGCWGSTCDCGTSQQPIKRRWWVENGQCKNQCRGICESFI